MNLKAPFDINTWGSYRPGSYWYETKIAPPILLVASCGPRKVCFESRIRHMVAADELNTFHGFDMMVDDMVHTNIVF